MSEFGNQSVIVTSSEEFNISDKAIYIYMIVVCSVICQMINVFGIATNIISIVCFVNQGFKDSINVSLLGLSLSDLASIVTLTLSCIFLCPAVAAADVPFESFDICYLASGIPHLTFTRISGCITAMIALERCLSIAAPLKLKSMVTPQRTTIIVISMFIVFTCSAAPIYFVNGFGEKFSLARNKTIIGLVFRQYRDEVETITFSINNFVIPVAAFVIIIMCMVILALQLRKNTQWRKATVTQAQGDKFASRNQKVAKMVVFISTLFIVCFIPNTTIMFAIALEPKLFINGKYIKITLLITGITYVMESINCSMNIFIYYNMSSKYRETFHKIFVKPVK